MLIICVSIRKDAFPITAQLDLTPLGTPSHFLDPYLQHKEAAAGSCESDF